MPKSLIVACDGTWNAVEETQEGATVSTNVSMLAASLAATNAVGERQLVFYMEGVGSAGDERVIGGAFGWGLSANVLRGYHFLVRNYEPGDAIYLFGFSRGAFTARSIGGMVRNCGILRRDELGALPDALALYADRDGPAKPDSIRSQVFRQMHSHEATIEIIGVWDTVGSLGVPGMSGAMARALEIGWHFHDLRLGSHIRRAFHGVALHERRGTFPPALWEKGANAPADQELEQRWFAGVHSDVGGGYVERGLSDLALKWMVSKCQSARDGKNDRPLAFRPSWETEIGCKPDPEIQVHNSYSAAFRWLDRLIERAVFTQPKGCVRCPALINRSAGHVVDPSVLTNLKKHPGDYPDRFAEHPVWSDVAACDPDPHQ